MFFLGGLNSTLKKSLVNFLSNDKKSTLKKWPTLVLIFLTVGGMFYIKNIEAKLSDHHNFIYDLPMNDTDSNNTTSTTTIITATYTVVNISEIITTSSVLGISADAIENTTHDFTTIVFTPSTILVDSTTQETETQRIITSTSTFSTIDKITETSTTDKNGITNSMIIEEENQKMVLPNIKYDLLENTPPTQGIPYITPATANSSEDITCNWNNTYDADMDNVVNITRWYRNNHTPELLYLPFESNSTSGIPENNGITKDFSSYDNVVNIINATWNRTGGVIGGGYYLDENSYMVVPNNNEFDGSFTVLLWFKKETSTYGVLVGRQQSSSKEEWLIEASNAVSFSSQDKSVCTNGGWDVITDSSNYTLGEWTHVAVTVESGVERRLYVNGNMVANSYNYVILPDCNLDTYIGKRERDSGCPINSSIDEVRFYNYTLSAGQIYQDFLAGNQSKNTNIIVNNETTVGEEWKCVVTPDDGYDEGVTLNSSSLTVTKSEVTVSLDYPEDKWYVNDPIRFGCTGSGIMHQNISLYHNYSGSFEVDQTVNVSGASVSIQFNSSGFTVDKTLIWNCKICDETDCYFAPSNITLMVDVTGPNISFISPTPEDGSSNISTQNSAYINVSVNDSSDNVSAFINWDGSLQGWWRFEESDCQFFADYSGYGRNGTSSGSTCPLSEYGIRGNTFKFEGIKTDILTITDSDSWDFANNNATVILWVKNSPVTNNQCIMEHFDGGSPGEGWHIDFLGAQYIGKILFGHRGINGIDLRSKVRYDDDKWHHIAAVINQSENMSYLYIDGIFQDSDDYSGLVDWNQQIYIGNYPGYYYNYEGYIDEFQIWSRPLSPEEINASYQAGLNRLYKNFTDLPVGSYTYQVYAVDQAGNLNQTELRTLEINDRPTFFNITEPTDPSTYSSGASYQFNVTVTDTEAEPSVVFVEFNDTTGILTNLANFTMSNQSSEYYYTFTDLPVGTYNYKFYSNDTLDEWNSTQGYKFTINKTATQLTLTAIPSWSETYGAQIVVGGTESNSGDGGCTYKLYRNDIEVTNPETITLAAYKYNYTYNVTSCQNYTTNEIWSFLNISQATPICNLYLNGSTDDQTYNSNQIVNLTGHVNTSYDVTIYLDMNATGYGNEFTSDTNSSVENLTNTKILTEGKYNITTHFNGDQNHSSCSDTIYLTVFDTTLPNITLISPANKSGDNDGNVTFVYEVNDNANIINCSLIINGEINQTNTTIQKGTIMNFELNNLYVGSYNWSIMCNSSVKTKIAGTRTISIIKTTEFSGNTTNFNNKDTQNINNLIIDQSTYGSINFSEIVDLSQGANINEYVNISFNRIEINSSALPNLNKSAKLTFRNLTFSNPRLIKDNKICPSSICANVSYSNGTLICDVTEFSAYSSEETPSLLETSASSSRSSHRCNYDQDCNYGQYCFEYQCYNYGYVNATDCEYGQYYFNNTCHDYECMENKDCKEDYYCYEHECVKLFDMEIIRIDSPIQPGEFLDFTYFVKGMSNISGDVKVEFWIENITDKVISGFDTFFLGSYESKTKTKDLFLSDNIPQGSYNFYIQVNYEDYSAKAFREIQVKKEIPLILDIILSEINPEKSDLNFYAVLSFNKDEPNPIYLHEIIKNDNGKVFWSKERKMEIIRSKRIDETARNLKPGDYTLELEAFYNNKTYKISETFTVESTLTDLIMGYILILILFSCLTVYFIFRSKKQVKEGKKVENG